MSAMPSDPGADRRPIAARRLRIFQVMAARLADWGVAPNAISVAGMASGVAAGAALAATAWWPGAARPLWLAAAALVQGRLLANMLDGMVALHPGRAPSRLGELYNEAPDRVSDAATLIGLGYAAGGEPWLGYVAAILAVFTAYVRALGKAAGAPNDFRGPMAKQQRMALVTAAAIYMALAPASWRPETWRSDARGLAAAILALIAVGCVITSARRLAAAARALRSAGP